MTTTEHDTGPTPGANTRAVTAGDREAAMRGVINEHEAATEGGVDDGRGAVAGSETPAGIGVVGMGEVAAGVGVVGVREVAAGVGVAGGRRAVAGHGIARGRAMDGGREGVASRGGAVAGILGRVEVAFVGLAGRFGVPALRITLALTFLWFGVLKITNDTPVGDFVASTVDWIPGVSGSWFVPFLGVVEVLLGAALLVGRGLRIVLPLLFAHLVGTFLALVTQPEVAFQGGNPVMLTTEGEFVVKNLILLSAVLVLYGLQRARVARS